MSGKIKLGVSIDGKAAYVGKANNIRFPHMIINKQDVTKDFKRCIVNFCSEPVEFEIDGMRFKATCERID